MHADSKDGSSGTNSGGGIGSIDNKQTLNTIVINAAISTTPSPAVEDLTKGYLQRIKSDHLHAIDSLKSILGEMVVIDEDDK